MAKQTSNMIPTTHEQIITALEEQPWNYAVSFDFFNYGNVVVSGEPLNMMD